MSHRYHGELSEWGLHCHCAESTEELYRREREDLVINQVEIMKPQIKSSFLRDILGFAFSMLSFYIVFTLSQTYVYEPTKEYIKNDYITDSSRQIIDATPRNCSAASKNETWIPAICNKDIRVLHISNSEKWIVIFLYGEFKGLFPGIVFIAFTFVFPILVYRLYKILLSKTNNFLNNQLKKNN